MRIHAFNGELTKSSPDGAPKAQKSAWTTRTRNIEIICNNSKFDCRGPFVIEKFFVMSNECLNFIKYLIRSLYYTDLLGNVPITLCEEYM